MTILARDHHSILYPSKNTVDEMWEKFRSTMMDGRFIPKRTRRPVNSKKNLQPFTADLRRLVRRKHRLWNRWITTKNDNVFDEYKIVRNKVKRETVKIVQQEQDKISRDCESNPKRFWRYVNRKKTNKKLSYR